MDATMSVKKAFLFFLSFVNRRRERKEIESKEVRYNTLGTSLVPYTVPKAFKQWSENWVVEYKSPLKTANSSWWQVRIRVEPTGPEEVPAWSQFTHCCCSWSYPPWADPCIPPVTVEPQRREKAGELEPCFCLLLLTILVAILSTCFLDTWFSNL